MLKFQINAKADVTAKAEVLIYGDVGEGWWEETIAAADFVRHLNELKNEEITIRVNSVGGTVPDGIAIYNAIKRHPSAIEIVIDGMAYSIASMIAMAAPCTMADNALMMIHAPMVRGAGNARDLRIAADMLDRWAESMASAYAQKSGKSAEDIIATLLDGDDHYFTAAEAQAEGFVDQITEAMPVAASLRIPAAALSRFQTPHNADPFVIHAARAAATPGGSLMDREQKIRALFEAHASNAELMSLCDELIADKGIAVEVAQARLNEALEPKHPDEAAIEARVLARESKRRNDIAEAFQPFMDRPGTSELLSTCQADTRVTAQAARDRLLLKLGEAAEPVAGQVVVRENAEVQKFRDGVVAAILSRAGLADKDTRALAKQSGFHNYTLMEMAKASLSRGNYDFSNDGAPQIAQAALTQSTSDFSVLLEDAMHKALLQAYRITSDTWSRFCRVGSVSDFRSHGRYRTGSIGNYTTVDENGEYKQVAIPDGEKASIAASDLGLIINLTYKMIVDDDLGAFVGLASDLGRAGRRTVEAAVYALLAENAGLGPTMLDGHPLFDDTNHSNVGTGAALTSASIEADRVLMASQMDVGGNDFLDLRPAIWVGPIGLGATARVINDAQYDPDTANKLQKPNAVRGLFSDIVDTPRLSGTRHYAFADPSEAPVIEVAFLNGEQEPYILMEEAFSSRGAKYRATLDFGVGVIDYRGATTNAGA